MRTKPGEVYLVDLGFSGKVRPMVVVSREDADPSRAIVLCAPVTTAYLLIERIEGRKFAKDVAVKQKEKEIIENAAKEDLFEVLKILNIRFIDQEEEELLKEVRSL